METKIENFSNEIFFEIFDYLDGLDILTAFSNLNSRLEILLHSPSLRYKIRYSFSQSADVFTQNRTQFVSHYSSQLYSLHLYYHAEFSSSLNLDSSFFRLRSVKLIATYSDVIAPLLDQLHQLPCLQSLNVHVEKFLSDMTDFYQMLFTLPQTEILSSSH